MPVVNLTTRAFGWAVVAGIVVGALGIRPAKAAPVITDFSSQGGNTTNKAGSADRMYLVTAGDQITFSVTATDVTAYEWRVNKAVQPAVTGDSFTWTVPDEKDIWEVHLTATGGGGETHQEWAVSTLSNAEAPVIFDSFTDGRFQSPRPERDPWGRELPNWQVRSKNWRDNYPYDVSKYMLKRPDGEWSYRGRLIGAQSDVTNGTWKFRYRFIGGQGDASFNFRPIMNSEASGFSCTWPKDQHRWFSRPNGQIAYRVVSWRGTMSFIPYGSAWHEVVITRTPEGYWRLWSDGVFLHSTLENDDFSAEELLNKYGFAGFGLSHEYEKTSRMVMDGIEVYRGAFLMPRQKIVLGQYIYRTLGATNSDMRTGITVDGKGVTLSAIAAAINDPSVFSYDPQTKTAVCRTDLNILGGAELVINGQTLKMHSTTDGGRVIRVNNGAAVRLDDATITSTNDYYYRWAFTSEYNPDYTWNPNTHTDGGADYGFKGIFIARNSTIDNCGFMYMVGPNAMVLENTRLTNLVQVAGDGRAVDEGRKYVKYSGAAHAMTFRLKTSVHRFDIRNCTFEGKGNDARLLFLGGDHVNEPTVIRDTTFSNMVVTARDVVRFHPFTNPDNPNLSCTLALLNCRFEEITAEEPSGGAAVRVMAKYYLDVKVVDADGNPVPGAGVTVANEQDNDLYGSESLFEEQKVEMARDEGFLYKCNDNAKFVKWIRGKKLASTTAMASGHTPPQSDRDRTMILTDFVQTSDGKTEFTYRITAEKDGLEKTVTGIDPGPSWYRPDSDIPTHTVTIVLGGPPMVVGRHVFYNQSAFDGNDPAANAADDDAIATDKTALLPGQTATFANYTSCVRGINGIMVDIDNLAGTPTAADFAFKVGNDNNPAGWSTAPAPSSITVRPAAGVGGAGRVMITWPISAIQQQWLQVTVKATAATGLTQPDVFYFGNAIGDSGNSPADTKVDTTDEVRARLDPHKSALDPADVENPHDYTRDGVVDTTDEIIARAFNTTLLNALNLITAP